MMRDTVASFLCLSTSDQIRYLKTGEFTRYDRDEKIDFLKTLLNADASSKTVACALKILRELKYRDKFFFRKFLYHVDSSVSNAARKAIEKSNPKEDSGVIRITDLIKRERGESRIAMVKSLLGDRKRLKESILISLLSIDDFRVREAVMENISVGDILDESLLAEGVKGAVWYVRASLVEILGKKQSEYVYELAEFLVHDKNVEVKLKLIEALVNLEQERSRVYLERLKDDPSTWVRREAEKALSKLQHR